MELLEQEWRRQQTPGASKPDSNEAFHHENRRSLCPRLNDQPTTERDHCFTARCLDAYARAHDYEISPHHIYQDEGFSGASVDRPALDALRDAVAAGELEAVLILSPDRLARI
jgi:Resolvase, N terminal domain